mmetsp:Transcript_4259/g.12825  ORF Transcript_4259/g.12825 Transcript_4259/m.12825 type:complete len:417 (-) Transcript_4259:19-1269(-)
MLRRLVGVASLAAGGVALSNVTNAFDALRAPVEWSVAGGKARWRWPAGSPLINRDAAAAFDALRGTHTVFLGNSVTRHVVIALHWLLGARIPHDSARPGRHALPEAESSIWAAHGAASAELDARGRVASDECKHGQRGLSAPRAVVNCCVARRRAGNASTVLTYAFTATPSEPVARATLKAWAGAQNCAPELAPDFVVIGLTDVKSTSEAQNLAALAARAAKAHPRLRRTYFFLVTALHKKKATRDALQKHEAAAVAAGGGRVVVVPVSMSTLRGVAAGALQHDKGNSYHYADAGRVFEGQMLLNAFALAKKAVCRDDGAWRMRETSAHNCDWVFEAPAERCSAQGRDGRPAADACACACAAARAPRPATARSRDGWPETERPRRKPAATAQSRALERDGSRPERTSGRGRVRRER